MPDDSLTKARYKTCGYGKPNYDREGHYDEVFCAYSKEPLLCGDKPCPLDAQDQEPDETDGPFFVDDSAQL
jgi:hypothetical protein